MSTLVSLLHTARAKCEAEVGEGSGPLGEPQIGPDVHFSVLPPLISAPLHAMIRALPNSRVLVTSHLSGIEMRDVAVSTGFGCGLLHGTISPADEGPIVRQLQLLSDAMSVAIPHPEQRTWPDVTPCSLGNTIKLLIDAHANRMQIHVQVKGIEAFIKEANREIFAPLQARANYQGVVTVDIILGSNLTVEATCSEIEQRLRLPAHCIAGVFGGAVSQPCTV